MLRASGLAVSQRAFAGTPSRRLLKGAQRRSAGELIRSTRVLFFISCQQLDLLSAACSAAFPMWLASHILCTLPWRMMSSALHSRHKNSSFVRSSTPTFQEECRLRWVASDSETCMLMHADYAGSLRAFRPARLVTHDSLVLVPTGETLLL